MQITHHGHACLLVETAGARLLIDPGTMSDFAGLRDLDAILVTHQHADHVDVDRLGALVAANPGARVVIDADSAPVVAPVVSDVVVLGPGEGLDIGGTRVDVVGGLHAAVYGDIPGCTNSAYLVDGGALLHPGDSFFVPEQDVDVLAVAIDGPWLKLAEAVDYVNAVGPRVALPIHEGEAVDPAKYAGMLGAFTAGDVVRTLPPGVATTL